MSGVVRCLTATAASLPSLFSRNFPIGRRQSYSTCWNCLKLKYVSTKYLAPVTTNYTKFNRYSSQSPGAGFSKFLDEEIAAEQESQKKLEPIPSRLHDFEIKLNGPEITLVKQSSVETIEIKLNVSNSLQEESGIPENVEGEGNDEDGLRVSKPPFVIEIKRGDTVLRLMCSYNEDGVVENLEDNYTPGGDIFYVEEIAIYKGEWEDSNYTVDAGVLGADVYNMILNLLEEKGITDQLIDDLSLICTSYEHTSYVSLLRDLKKFVS